MKTMNKKKKVVKKVAKEGSHQGFLSQALAEKHLFPRKIALKVLKDEDHAIEMPGLEASVIASRVDIEKVERERHSIADQLQKIFQRVGRLYENAGFPGNIKASHEEEAAALHIINRPPNHDGKRLRKLKTDREKFLKMVKSFSTASGSRFHLIEDVKDWLKNVEIGEELKTEEDYKQLDQECLESEAEVKNGLSHAFASIDEIKRIGYRLLEDAGYLDREDDVNHKRAKLFGQPPEIIYDTQDLLADKTGETIREASAEIKRVLQDTIRLVKTPAAKTMVRGGLKQYKNLMGVTEKSMEKSKTLEDEMSEKDSKLEELEAATENLTQLLDRTQVDIEKVHVVLNNKTVALGKITEENDILKKKHAALELMTTHLQEELTKVPSKHSAVIKESVDVGLAESVMLEEVERLRSRVENQEEEMRVLTEDLEAERVISVNVQSLLDQANARVESKDEGEKKLSEFMEENEDLKNQIVTLNSQLAEKDEIVLDLEKELVEMKLYSPVDSRRDLLKTSPNKSVSVVSIKQKVKEKPQKSSPASDHDLKKAISRLQKQTESEMNHLKDHMEREQQRHEAAIRKLEMDHKDHIAIIHKETVHLLRAINHFKESVAQILEKEDLLVEASEVYRLDNLPTEVNQQDPMLSLNRISGDAVELLVAVENKLSQALLNRRCEVKDSSQAMNTTSRELGVQMEITRRLRQQHSQLIEKQNATKDELSNVKGAVTAVKKSEALRYYSLYDRYKLLWIHNRNVQRELDNLKRDFLEAMKRREAALRTAISGRQDMVKTIEEQHEKLTKMQVDLRQRKSKGDSRFHMHMRDMRRNLITLEDALRDKQISRDMYQSAVDIVERAMMIPAIRLYHLFSRYIAFRRLTHFRDIVETHLEDAKEESLEACAMKCYLSKVENNIGKSTKAWQERTHMLDQERRELFSSMSTLPANLLIYSKEERIKFGVELKDTEVSHQRFQEVSNTNQILKEQQTRKELNPLLTRHQWGQNSSSITSQQKSKMGSVLAKTFFPRLESRETLVGRRCAEYSQSYESVWKPHLSPPVTSSVEIPKLLEYDINGSIKLAHREVEKTARAAYPLSYSEFYDYSASRLSSMTKIRKQEHIAQLRPSVDILITPVGSSSDI